MNDVEMLEPNKELKYCFNFIQKYRALCFYSLNGPYADAHHKANRMTTMTNVSPNIKTFRNLGRLLCNK